MYTFSKVFFILLLCTTMVQSYEQFDDYDKMMTYFMETSLLPTVQIYYNRHFGTSRQFDDFLSALQETEYKNKDFARFALINCEKIKEGDTPCEDLKRTKDNRKIIMMFPSTEFIKYGGKKLPSPQLSRVFNNRKDVVLPGEYEHLLQEIMPNFFEEIINLEDYYEWLKPRHIPKAVFLSRQEDIPLVLKKLGVHYFQRLDLGYVSDLTESIVSKMNITTFPKLLAINYNYEEQTYDIFQYKETDFSANSYLKIKEFLDQYALKEPRNDLLFTKIKIPAEKQLQSVSKKADIQKILDNANGWIIISEVKGEPIKLKALKQKYGRFFDYIHIVTENETESLKMFDRTTQKVFEFQDEITFTALGKQQYLQSSAAWLSKDYVVVTVREPYSYMCGVEQAPLFDGLTHCIVVKESEYEQTSKALNIPFEFGFVYYQTSAKIKEKLVGKTFKSANYEEVYNAVQQLTKRKSQEIVEDFKVKPVRQVEKTDTLDNICDHPNKRCALLFTHGAKRDRTAYEYLTQIALNFINDYEFLEIDLTCNKHFQDEISNLKSPYGGLAVYHPRKKSYVSLKARLSKSVFDKFLKANLRDNKKLPFHEFTKDIKIQVCDETEAETEGAQSDQTL